MKIAELPFYSLQGEGRYCGIPALFIRLSGCNRRCNFCDTSYAWDDGIEIDIKTLIKTINESSCSTIIITGGEPLIQRDDLYKVIIKIYKSKSIHFETNGDLIDASNRRWLRMFYYITFSPKDYKTAERLSKEILPLLDPDKYDVKVVTDLAKVNIDLIRFATILMPLTTANESENIRIKKKVWRYCAEKNIRYSPRLHVDVFGMNRRGV